MASALCASSRSFLHACRPSMTPSRRLPMTTQFLRTIVTTKYTAEHESVIFDDETSLGTVTITDYAQQSLGDVVFVELPTPGTGVSQGDTIGAVESVKAASDIYAPVSGTIMEVNTSLSDQPSLLNKDPENKGWLCKIKLSEPEQIKELLSKEDYLKTLEA
ncbi:glycine cleavage H-protein-domain-containing protein [Flagelloscypha sp. PMI_526]|nr:glycine cleavage H-protein-domain-containing protein [Flagelloscypha sp. PMI_526]